MSQKLTDQYPVEVCKNIWWIGFSDYESGFSNNPYLIDDGDEAVLIDPGPGHPVFRDIILQKIQYVTNPKKIRYIIVHHQDPDLCGLIPYLEKYCHPDLVIICHPRTALFLPYFGIRKQLLPVGDGDELLLSSGRRLVFHYIPYLHFSGNMASFDSSSSTLFTSDIFAVFNREWSLYADQSFLPLAQDFMEYYFCSKDALLYAYEVFSRLKPKLIVPQHGGIIRQELVNDFLELLYKAEPGQALYELMNKTDQRKTMGLLELAGNWYHEWTGLDQIFESYDELLDAAMEQGPSTVSLLLDLLSRQAKRLKIKNPLYQKKTHSSSSIHSTSSHTMLSAVRKKFLTAQYGLKEDEFELGAHLNEGFISFKRTVAVMFVDIRKFTKWCADKDSQVVFSMLNQHQAVVTDIIERYSGQVNKYLGDGILAYFTSEKASQCARAAIAIHEKIDELKLLKVGVGCDFGEVMIGDMGELNRLDYTLLGAPVNYASRMCDLSDAGGFSCTSVFIDQIDTSVRGKLDAFSNTTQRVQMKKNDPPVDAFSFQIT